MLYFVIHDMENGISLCKQLVFVLNKVGILKIKLTVFHQ